MTTPLNKPLKREVMIKGEAFVVTLSPEGIKVVLKGKRNGQQLRWEDLVSGEAALATALNASLSQVPELGERGERAAVAAKAPARAARRRKKSGRTG